MIRPPYGVDISRHRYTAGTGRYRLVQVSLFTREAGTDRATNFGSLNCYLRDPETGTLYGAVDVSYGTGEYTEDQCQIDLVIRDWEAVKRCGLHKPTRFALDTGNRKNLIWCEEYFVPPEYVEETGLLIGRLGEMEVDQMRLSLIRRGLFAA